VKTEGRIKDKVRVGQMRGLKDKEENILKCGGNSFQTVKE
jgi:hypothetical protein